MFISLEREKIVTKQTHKMITLQLIKRTVHGNDFNRQYVDC